MPAITSTVPAAIHTVKGSPRITTLIRMVDIGPTIPVWAAIEAPMRSTAIITASTGKAVQRVINDANDLKDLDTADLFTEVSRGIDKWL